MSDINPPEDAATVKLGDEIVDTMRKLFKTPQNYRPGKLVHPASWTQAEPPS